MFLKIKNKKKNREESSSTNDNSFRSILKTISWRMIGTLDTIVISWLITNTLTIALSIGLIELFTKMFLYYFHERIWNKINWGKN